MSDPFYPTVDYSFLEQEIVKSEKIIPGSKVKVGSTTTYVLQGKQALHKRIILIRELAIGEVSFEQATGLAIRFHFLGALLTWLEMNKGWKDGAYIEQ